jgi:hypothetical protein
MTKGNVMICQHLISIRQMLGRAFFATLLRKYMERRQDRVTALIIEAALHTCETHGLQTAALRMAEQGVPREVIVRLLVFRRQRRFSGARIAFQLGSSSPLRRFSASNKTYKTRYIAVAAEYADRMLVQRGDTTSL